MAVFQCVGVHGGVAMHYATVRLRSLVVVVIEVVIIIIVRFSLKEK
jgi:hypothetical protein